MNWLTNDKRRFAIIVAMACVLALIYKIDLLPGGFSERTVSRLFQRPRIGISVVFQTVGFLTLLWGTWLALYFTSVSDDKRKKIIAVISVGYIALCGFNLLGGANYPRDFAYTRNRVSVSEPSFSKVDVPVSTTADVQRMPAKVEVQKPTPKQEPPSPQTEPPLTEQEKVFYRLMDKYAPGWEKQNIDPGFLEWLEQRDPTYGFVRNAALQDAYSKLDARTVANIFLEYRKTLQK